MSLQSVDALFDTPAAYRVLWYSADELVEERTFATATDALNYARTHVGVKFVRLGATRVDVQDRDGKVVWRHEGEQPAGNVSQQSAGNFIQRLARRFSAAWQA